MNPSLFARVVVIPMTAGCWQLEASAQAHTDPKPGIPLEQIVARLGKIDEESRQKVDLARKVVDAEEAEKRISEAVAQSLRWSLRSAALAYSDYRSGLASAKIPADNKVLGDAFRELETALTSAQLERAEITANCVKEIRSRTTKLLLEPATVAEVGALMDVVDNVQESLKQRSYYGVSENQNRITNASSVLGQLKRLIEAEAIGDAAIIGRAAAEFRINIYDRDTVSESDRRRRLDATSKPFQKAESDTQKALEGALEAKKPAADLVNALTRYAEASENLRLVRGNDMNQPKELAMHYRALVDFWKAVETGEPESIRNRAQLARQALDSLGPSTAAKFGPIVSQLEQEVANRERAKATSEIEGLRRGISEAKSPADVDAILGAIQPVRQGARIGMDAEASSNLIMALSSIAHVWRSSSLGFAQNLEMPQRSGVSILAPELGALRLRVERDITSKALHAPELTKPPLSEKPLSEAVDVLADQLVQAKEWRRLLKLLEARASMSPADARLGRLPADETVTALRAYFVAQNFELAEMWKEAAESYSSVLRSTSQRAPIADAAERLKKLTKEHPETSAPPAPAAVHLQK